MESRRKGDDRYCYDESTSSRHWIVEWRDRLLRVGYGWTVERVPGKETDGSGDFDDECCGSS